MAVPILHMTVPLLYMDVTILYIWIYLYSIYGCNYCIFGCTYTVYINVPIQYIWMDKHMHAHIVTLSYHLKSSFSS